MFPIFSLDASIYQKREAIHIRIIKEIRDREVRTDLAVTKKSRALSWCVTMVLRVYMQIWEADSKSVIK